jgi:hypothetical protein
VRPRQALSQRQTLLWLEICSLTGWAQATREEIRCLCGQFRVTGLTYPHGQRPVTGENRCLRFLYHGHRVYLRRAACAFSRFARTTANLAADFERPPRRPILEWYLVTSEGTAHPTESRFHRQATPYLQKASLRIPHFFAASYQRQR